LKILTIIIGINLNLS